MAAPEAADAAPEAPAAKEAPPGEALAPTDEVVEKSPRERYLRFKELIGKGSYKEVWRAYDSVEGIEVAWNVVNLKNMPAHEKARVKWQLCHHCPGPLSALLDRFAGSRNPEFRAKKSFQREVRRLLEESIPIWLGSTIKKRMDPPQGR